MSPVVVAAVACVLFIANLAYVLRPSVAPTWDPGRLTGAPAPGLRGWARRHYSICLSLARAALNGTVATVFLLEVGYPLAASFAEGIAAGLLSGLFQLAVVNERLAAYLNRARGEIHRVLKWAWIEAVFYGLVKAAGTLAGGGPGDVSTLLFAYVVTVTFGCAQYPWEAAIAASRAMKREQGQGRDQIRFVADLQTMAVSMTCVGVSILNSVGVPGSRLFLAGVGVAGIGTYGLVRLRWRLWRAESQARARAAGPGWTRVVGGTVSLARN